MARHRKEYAIKGVRTKLGTIVTVVLIHSDIDEGSHALHAAFDEIDRISDLMSVRKETSEVALMNRNGCCDHVSSDTRYVIQRANYYAELSNGVFDITILPLLQLWEETTRRRRVPLEAEIDERLGLVDYRNIIIDEEKISFRKAGMGITLAGAAKGYAVDRAGALLRQNNIDHALVNAGGDIVAIGGKTDTDPWKIAIRDPKEKTRFAGTVELRDQAIATSGTYWRPFNDIFDAKEGKPARGVVSATVVAEKAIDADILATSIFVLGAEKGRELIGRLERVESFVVEGD